ncbi:gag/pol protein [Cucumis melo var. makuwa]|uniref:Gag/pol protein n=1 Tax=Cucumis melo var. makuwa TaxID=1194695 RepID=A0A5A7TC93_CUCMM|nr:gag/pol protein [Cucumis melo var. makuwa]
MVTSRQIIDSLQEMFKGQKEKEKKKGGKGKRSAATAKGNGKAKVANKGKSFLGNVNGHCKRNYPKNLVKKKNEKEAKYDLLVLETCLVKNDQNA